MGIQMGYMAQKATADGGESSNEQAEYVQRVQKIVVDPEDVIRHLQKNAKLDGTLYDQRKFKLTGFKNDGVASVSIGVDPRDDGGYYPDKPHPIWVRPSRFVHGWSRGEDSSESLDIGVPDEAENRRQVRETVDVEEGTEEFEAECEDGMEVWEEMFESAVRRDLKDEIEFVFGERIPEMETVRHTAEVEYVEEDE